MKNEIHNKALAGKLNSKEIKSLENTSLMGWKKYRKLEKENKTKSIENEMYVLLEADIGYSDWLLEQNEIHKETI